MCRLCLCLVGQNNKGRKMEKIKTAFICTLGGMFTLFVALLFALCLLTPEKTNGGDYVQPWEYWTSAEYIKANF